MRTLLTACNTQRQQAPTPGAIARAPALSSAFVCKRRLLRLTTAPAHGGCRLAAVRLPAKRVVAPLVVIFMLFSHTMDRVVRPGSARARGGRRGCTTGDQPQPEPAAPLQLLGAQRDCDKQRAAIGRGKYSWVPAGYTHCWPPDCCLRRLRTLLTGQSTALDAAAVIASSGHACTDAHMRVSMACTPTRHALAHDSCCCRHRHSSPRQLELPATPAVQRAATAASSSPVRSSKHSMAAIGGQSHTSAPTVTARAYQCRPPICSMKQSIVSPSSMPNCSSRWQRWVMLHTKHRSLRPPHRRHGAPLTVTGVDAGLMRVPSNTNLRAAARQQRGRRSSGGGGGGSSVRGAWSALQQLLRTMCWRKLACQSRCKKQRPRMRHHKRHESSSGGGGGPSPDGALLDALLVAVGLDDLRHGGCGLHTHV